MEEKNILIVDDEKPIRDTLKEILDYEGFKNIFTARNGIECLEIIENVIPDIIMLNGRMPKMDGLETLKHLKSSAKTNSIPVFMCSGGNGYYLTEGLKYGSSGSLEMPLNLNEFFSVIYISLCHQDNDYSYERIKNVISFTMKIFSKTMLDSLLRDCGLLGFLRKLTNLRILDLSESQLAEIPELKELVNLTSLDLSNNPIQIIPEWICDFPDMDIQIDKHANHGFITFDSNPIENIPVDIIKQGKNAVKAWFAANKQKCD